MQVGKSDLGDSEIASKFASVMLFRIGMEIIIPVILICLFFFVLAVTAILIVKVVHRRNELLKTVTVPGRGTRSERRLLLRLLRLKIPAIIIYHDLYIERRRSHYSQIDAVVVTRVGIIVFEVKDYSGWIFGKGYQQYWTQVLSYRKEKHRFYNPVKQNEGHIDVLLRYLKDMAEVPFYSVIIFYGSSLLKNISGIPPGTYIGYPRDVAAIINHITTTNPPASYKDKWGVVNALKAAAANGNNMDIVNQHIINVHNLTH